MKRVDKASLESRLWRNGFSCGDEYITESDDEVVITLRKSGMDGSLFKEEPVALDHNRVRETVRLAFNLSTSNVINVWAETDEDYKTKKVVIEVLDLCQWPAAMAVTS